MGLHFTSCEQSCVGGARIIIFCRSYTCYFYLLIPSSVHNVSDIAKGAYLGNLFLLGLWSEHEKDRHSSQS